jgi:hypothetical protein
MPPLSTYLVFAGTVVGCGFGDDRLRGVDPDAGVADAASTSIDARPGADAAPSPDAPPAACSLVPQSGCPGGRACDFGTGGSHVCRDVTVPGTTDDTCAGATQCAAGYSCISTSGSSSCLELCAVDGDCAPATGSRCVIDVVDGNGQPIPGGTYCSQACNPRSSAGCPSAWNCALFDDAAGDYTRCVAAGTGTQGATCTSLLSCAPGYDCVSHDGVTTCLRNCRLGVTGDCAAGLSCRGFAGGLVVGSVEWGVCL